MSTTPSMRPHVRGAYRCADVRFVAPDGEVIRLTKHDPGGVLRERQPFHFYVRASLAPFERIAATLAPLPASPPDPRTARRRGGALTDVAVWAVRIAQLALARSRLRPRRIVALGARARAPRRVDRPARRVSVDLVRGSGPR